MTQPATCRISAKNLGALALPDCCGRCLWLRHRLAWKTPWAVMPGIFSSIDSVTKKVVASHVSRHGKLPPWLEARWPGAAPMPSQHHSKFWVRDAETDIVLTGVPDEMLRLGDNTIAILDYKTARHTENQDAMSPVYRIQLTGYAIIAEALGLGAVSAIALVYCEPPDSIPVHEADEVVRADGFAMMFRATVVPLPLVRPSVAPLLRRARELFDMPSPPPGRAGCGDCAVVGRMLALAGMR